MNIFTSYRLMQAAGLERSDPLFRGLSAAIGGPRSYGFQKPIDLATILDVEGCGIGDALWTLGAAYPEQATAAGRIARRVAITSYNLASVRFAEKNPVLTKAMVAAVDYSRGYTDAANLAKHRRRVFATSANIHSAYRHVFMLAWIACAAPDRSAVIASGAADALRHAFPADAVADRPGNVLHVKAAEDTVRAELQRALAGNAGDGPGPGEFLPPNQMPRECGPKPWMRKGDGELSALQLSLDECFGIGA